LATWRQLNRAIEAGTLARGPCEVFGTMANTQGHHEDYSQPFAVA
jgi:hypothetical protein